MTFMQILRTNFLRTIISWVVMLQLLNISIDPPDRHYGPEDLSINDIESCLELVLEVFLGHDNLIDEVDDQDDESGQPTNALTLFAVETPWTINDERVALVRQEDSMYTELFVPNYCRPVQGPPPKSV